MAEPNWNNRTLWTGDNLPIMRGLNSESVDLIYLDPPFNSKKNYSAPIGSLAAGASFKDFWTFDDVDRLGLELLRETDPPLFHVIETARLVHGDGMAAYLGMMAQRIKEMRRLLKPTGSIYLHCDATASHYLKVLMDYVFKPPNSRNEIIWSYQRWTGATNHFQRMHDNILFYSASAQNGFNILTEPYSGKSKHKSKRHSTVGSGGKLDQIYTDDTSRQKSMRDVWEISYLNSQAKERTGYPTQKPLALLERIIEASLNPGDVVCDPFCGCATTCVSAEKLGRKWIGIDIAVKAIDLVESRLQDAIDELEMFHPGDVIHRTDQPYRTDLGKLPRYTENKDKLYGEQGGDCGGCGEHFLKRNLTIDHIVPRKHGGTDHIENLWLLCQACNSSKGVRSQVEFLRDRMSRRPPNGGRGCSKQKHEKETRPCQEKGICSIGRTRLAARATSLQPPIGV